MNKLFSIVALGISVSAGIGAGILVVDILSDKKPQNLGKTESFLADCGIIGLGVAANTVTWQSMYSSLEAWGTIAEAVFTKSPKVV